MLEIVFDNLFSVSVTDFRTPPTRSRILLSVPAVRIPGVMKKFDQNANFQNCDQGVEMLFSVTFRDIPKIDNHGSNSHLAPNVCFGNDMFFENPNIFPKKIHDFF